MMKSFVANVLILRRVRVSPGDNGHMLTMENQPRQERLPASLVICGVAIGLMSVAPGSRAQTSPEASPRADSGNLGVISEVVVTGSRLPNASTNLESVSPVAVVSREDITLTGTQRIEDLLNSMPQVLATDTVNMGNLSTGTATVNLRGLGPTRTMVLMNGRRMPPGDPTNIAGQSPDLNNIPSALLERVEILSGGASAVYGSDAIAGVVNFITLKNFEGFRVDATSSIYQHENDNSAVRNAVVEQAANNPSAYRVAPRNVWEGSSQQITLVGGMNSPNGNGNITAFASYLDTEKVSQSKYDSGSCNLNSGDAFDTCVGSVVSPSGQFLALDPVSGDLVANPLTVDPTSGDFRDFDFATDTFNGTPFNLYQRPTERYNLGVFGHYEVSEALDFYTQLTYMEDKTSYQISPSGLFGGFSGVFNIACSDPRLSAQQQAALCAGGNTSVDMIIFRRNVEGGPEQVDITHNTYSVVGGVRGKFGSGWNYDVYAQYGEAELEQRYSNDISRSRLPLAMNAVLDPATGEVVCQAVLTGEDPACVPYNLFTPQGVTPAALAYIQTGGVEAGAVRETNINASINSDLGQYGIKTPWVTTGIGIALGAEYRRQSLNYHPDLAFTSGDLSGAGARIAQRGDLDVAEVFGEVRVPVIEDRFFAKNLSIEAGYRYSRYQNFDAKSNKLGVEWAPVEDLRFRSSYQRAVRAPSVYELFAPNALVLALTTDPCAGATPTATAEQCALTGVSASQYGNIIASNFGYNGTLGGNAGLEAENADTLGVGLVLTPRFVRNLSVAIDWFDIKVKGFVGQIGADLTMESCVNTGSSFFCDKIHRSPGTGSLWLSEDGFVEDTLFNVGELRTTGVDADVNYHVELGGRGSLGFQLFGTWTDRWDTNFVPAAGTPGVGCAGFFGLTCGLPTPEWRHTLRATWSTPWNVGLTVSWNHISEVGLGSEQSPADPAIDPATDLRLPAFDYIDLAANWQISDTLSLRSGVSNITDEAPPLIGRFNLPFRIGSGNTFPTYYETLGRYLFVGLTADF